MSPPSLLLTTASNTPTLLPRRTSLLPCRRRPCLDVSTVVTILVKLLGKKAQGAVITVPRWFEEAQKHTLEKTTADAGIVVLRLGESGRGSRHCHKQFTDGRPRCRPHPLVDLGTSALELSLLSACSVESLKDGLDFTGTITRLRFDMEGTVVGGGVADSTTILARGCAMQAKILAGLADGTESAQDRQDGVPVVLKDTPVPARCPVAFDIDFGEGEGEKRVRFEL
ncbi:uncharacterized protein BXZ73DRAFT_104636 [Epithele typhae]|uniref:uncharacterized protein n=1 Tax=Epithele typhae TaxID=378194 RepID=UPI00200887F6|nr:uncharacterized protein BXZ73DRAFT_104636 [Epithele typhae]KAH9920510.1 hypothetical protein BXZ73DRAFT_104636 [Epithele typhae]